MKEFISAALPWVLAGVAIAILCAKLGRREQGSLLDQKLATGLALGLLFGVALNNCGLWEDHALGLALGPLWGVALAALSEGSGPSEGGQDGPKQ